MHQGGGHMGPQQPLPGPPPRYPPNQGQWTATGQPRPNGPRAGPPNGPPQRPQMVNKIKFVTLLYNNNEFAYLKVEAQNFEIINTHKLLLLWFLHVYTRR